MLVNQPFFLFLFFFYPIMIDHVRIQSDVLRSRSGTDEKSLPDNTHQLLQFPMLSVAPCFSFSPIKSDRHCNESSPHPTPLLFFWTNILNCTSANTV